MEAERRRRGLESFRARALLPLLPLPPLSLSTSPIWQVAAQTLHIHAWARAYQLSGRYGEDYYSRLVCDDATLPFPIPPPYHPPAFGPEARA